MSNRRIDWAEGFAIAAERDHLKAVNAELVEALEQICDYAARPIVIKIARAAIAKARKED